MNKWLVAVCLVFGFACGLILTTLVVWDGYWSPSIARGTYTVTSVQVLGEEVYLTIQVKEGTPNTPTERTVLRPYRLPLKGFVHPFDKNGTRLTVIKEGEYRYLRLEVPDPASTP